MLLTVDNLQTSFYLRSSVVKAVRGVSFTVGEREVVGIVGESGSGKTVLAHTLLRLIPQPPGRTSGRVLFENVDLLTCPDAHLRAIRGDRVAMIFQDPSASFNPYMRLADQLIEPLMLHRKLKRVDALAAVAQALQETGITNAHERMHAFPHEFSGGMLQRAMIAMALVMRPALVIADEPTTALDVTVQAQLLRLMHHVRDEYALSIMLITHNLGIVAGFCDRVLVMYGGILVESASVEELFYATAHPYTHALIRSVPTLDTAATQLYTITGTPPDPTVDHKGCPFFERCSFAAPCCRENDAVLQPIGAEHTTACIRMLRGEIAL